MEGRVKTPMFANASLRRFLAAAMVASLLIVVAGCGSSGSSSSGGSTSASASTSGAPSWCGSKKVTIALADGFGDNNWRRITTGEARDEVKKCPNVTTFKYTDGQGNTQKAISDINSLVAQGVNGMVVFPDAGKAVLPAIRQPYNVTNWDPAQTQKVVTAVLAKNPKIDAITTDFGAALASSFPAFKQAGRQIPAVATEDSNLLSCDRKKLLASNPGFKLFTVDSQNWMVRTAIVFAVAKAS